MKTIGAKDLRQHMDEILDRVLNGEDIIVQHRFKNPVRLSAVHAPAATDAKRLAGLHAFEAAPKQSLSLDPNKSIKELYHESLDARYEK
jgi:antitoxin (DNA-binding transcriptional repressor) of toxin-antitoxin stability system